MFYAQYVLSKKGPLAKIWLAAHWEKKLTKAQVFETNVESAVDAILEPKVKMALRTTGHLLLGIVRIYSRKAKYLLADCNEAFLKIKMAFRPGQVDLPEEGREAQANAINLPEVFHDFDSALPEFNDMDYQQQMSLNQSRIDDITLKEDLPARTGFGNDFSTLAGNFDDFGDAFGDDDGFEPLEPIPSGSRDIGGMVEGGRGVEGGLELDAGIPDDFGDFDNNMFMDDIFNDETLRDIENMDTAPGEEDEGKEGGVDVTLMHQDVESFALEPLDATVMHGLDKHKRKKRKLVVDDVKNIAGDEMKHQMSHFDDIVRVSVEVAPPTKKLMSLKESGGCEKLLNMPGTGILSCKKLAQTFAARLAVQGSFEDEDLKTRSELMEELQLTSDPIEEARAGSVDAERLSMMGAEESHILPDQIHEDEPVPSVSPPPDDDSPVASPIPREKEKSTKKERRSKNADSFRADESLEEGEEGDDRKWTKRTQHILHTLQNKLKNQDSVYFTEISKGATRKSAAQKFYTLLTLKKWHAVEVKQDEPFGDIMITAGPQLNDQLSHA